MNATKPTDSRPGLFLNLLSRFVNRLLPPSMVDPGSLAYWRELILFAILSIGVVMAAFVLIPSAALVIREKIWGQLILIMAALLGAVALLFIRRISYGIRASVVVFMTYLIGLGVLISFGPISGGMSWLFAFTVLSGVLLGVRTAIIALTVNILTLLLLAGLANSGLLGDAYPVFRDMGRAAAALANFILVSTVSAISAAVLARGMASSYEKEKSLFSSLEAEQVLLKEAKERLEIEVEERKRAEEQTRASLQEKEVLLGEIHHRVKNNMQVIISLLNLQSAMEHNETVLEALRLSQNRISAMALVHESLYKSESMAEINLKKYLTGLVNRLSSAYSRKDLRISVILNIEEEIYVGMDQAVPCGLALNELISNSLKHAFRADGDGGRLEISAGRLNDGRVEIMIRDNGVGLPEGLDWRNSNTLGLSLVTSLVERQLKGELELKAENGTSFIITFLAKE